MGKSFLLLVFHYVLGDMGREGWAALTPCGLCWTLSPSFTGITMAMIPNKTLQSLR